uniref:hypothetical protein n=1 Tax=Streptomyces niveiscabiei TaxID=164115 RepID=UPI0038F69845
ELAGQGAPVKTGERADKLTTAGREAFEALAKDALAKSGEMPNVAALVEAVRAALTLPLTEGLATERALFVKLLADERSKALRYV